MDAQTEKSIEPVKATAPTRAVLPTPPVIDPLRRVFVPREHKHTDGTSSFEIRGKLYLRGVDGAIRSQHTKIRRKKDRVATRRALRATK